MDALETPVKVQLGSPFPLSIWGYRLMKMLVPGTLGPAPYRGCTSGWGAPGSLIRTLSGLPPLPHFRQQYLGNIGALITDAAHPLFRN